MRYVIIVPGELPAELAQILLEDGVFLPEDFASNRRYSMTVLTSIPNTMRLVSAALEQTVIVVQCSGFR